MCLFLFAFLSGCRSGDPMDPYRDLGAPKGFGRDTYPDMRNKKSGKEKKKNSKSLFGQLFEEEQEKKRNFRDVSRPMESGSVQVFPWREGERRSSKLYDEIRREKKKSTPVFW